MYFYTSIQSLFTNAVQVFYFRSYPYCPYYLKNKNKIPQRARTSPHKKFNTRKPNTPQFSYTNRFNKFPASAVLHSFIHFQFNIAPSIKNIPDTISTYSKLSFSTSSNSPIYYLYFQQLTMELH